MELEFRQNLQTIGLLASVSTHVIGVLMSHADLAANIGLVEKGAKRPFFWIFLGGVGL